MRHVSHPVDYARSYFRWRAIRHAMEMRRIAQEELVRRTYGLEAHRRDSDGDGVVDAADNCVLRYNPVQYDYDIDGVGDVCDGDDDNDTTPDGLDPSPFNAAVRAYGPHATSTPTPLDPTPGNELDMLA